MNQAFITAYKSYTALADDDVTRRANYRQLIADHIDPDETESIRKHTGQQRAFGNERFQVQIEALTGRAAIVRLRGRPKLPSQRRPTPEK